MADYLPGSIKHLNMLLGEQLTEGQGGGSSDFSTAQVTVTRAQSKSIALPYLYNDDETSALLTFVSDSGEYTAVLYKGVCIASAFDLKDPMLTPTIVVTGNATANGPEIIITGDCTITIS